MAEKTPAVIFCAAGGARMQEGILSLMQMAKTSAALAYHAQQRLPYISVLTHPTTAGVMASYASLGDLFISTGGSTRAWDSYSQALRCDQSYVPALYNLSVMSAARGDPATARILAERAYRLRPDLEAIRKLYLQLTQHPSPSP